MPPVLVALEMASTVGFIRTVLLTFMPLGQVAGVDMRPQPI